MVGPMPTPAVAMLTQSMRADLGVMISASHNPFVDNGIKLFGPDGYKLSDEDEMAIEALIEARAEAGAGRADRPRAPDRGCAGPLHPRRQVDLSRSICGSTGSRSSVDCANGAAYQVAPAALWELGAEVIAIGVEPNGTNINDGCGSTAPQAAQARRWSRAGADIGLALDGDADRLIVVDEKGEIDRRRPVDGADRDQLGAARGGCRAAGIVATVMSNLGLERFLAADGLELDPHPGRRPLCARGDARERLQRRRRAVRPHHPVRLCDDRRRAGRGRCRCSPSWSQTGRPASEMLHLFEPLPQLLKNVRFNGGKPLEADGGQGGDRRRPRPRWTAAAGW